MAAATSDLTESIILSDGLVWPPMEPTSALSTDRVIFIVLLKGSTAGSTACCAQSILCPAIISDLDSRAMA